MHGEIQCDTFHLIFQYLNAKRKNCLENESNLSNTIENVIPEKII